MLTFATHATNPCNSVIVSGTETEPGTFHHVSMCYPPLFIEGQMNYREADTQYITGHELYYSLGPLALPPSRLVWLLPV
jgi:hypothetical protein